jgi:prolyl-tRNA synthetase
MTKPGGSDSMNARSTSRTAVSPTRAQDFPEWYQQVVRAADLAENSPVRGCMVIKPWGYGIWERVQQALDRRIKETGHDNCYFPLFIPLRFFEREAQHVEGFAKEMAVVTHHRLAVRDGRLQPDSALEEPLIVRPTSETVIGEAFNKWIQSYRDLPLLINQWCNVVRWEMRPRLFLRTTEFLWQEGHTAHATSDEAMAETRRMLQVYQEVADDVMAIPVISGEKPENERFPGAVSTLTIEAMMQDGKALQAGTSHYLGQNFARAAEIRFQTKEGDHEYVYTTSWGASTRLVGGLVMVHGDDDGLRLPPRLAPRQVVIVPIYRNESDLHVVTEYAEQLAAALRVQQFDGEVIRTHVDKRDLASADKRWEWIKKGVPLVCEVGPRDLDNQSVAVTRRDRLRESKYISSRSEFIHSASAQLAEIQLALRQDAIKFQRERTRTDIMDVGEFYDYFANDVYAAKRGFVRAKWSGNPASEKKLAELGVTIRCIPFDQDGQVGTCVLTGAEATTEVIFAKAY